MRTNIEIDDELLSQAMTAAGLSTKRATVEEGLRLLVRVRKQAEALVELKGLGLGRRPGRDASGSSLILVDTSVWIAHLRGHRTLATTKLEAAAAREPLLIGDLILLEVLQGARDEARAARIERGLRRYALVPLLDADLAPRAARNYRKLRELGVTIRKTADIIIGTFWIERCHWLLHDDRDFAPMEEHLGLKAV